MMSQTEFENYLSDYVRGTLSPQERQEVEEYLSRHPEALKAVKEVRDVLTLTAPIREDQPPAELLQEARAGLLEQISLREPSATRPQVIEASNWFRDSHSCGRPTFRAWQPFSPWPWRHCSGSEPRTWPGPTWWRRFSNSSPCGWSAGSEARKASTCPSISGFRPRTSFARKSAKAAPGAW